jgi:hypothetical protein
MLFAPFVLAKKAVPTRTANPNVHTDNFFISAPPAEVFRSFVLLIRTRKADLRRKRLVNTA